MNLRQLVVERIDDMNYPMVEKKRNKKENQKRLLQQVDNQYIFFFTPNYSNKRTVQPQNYPEVFLNHNENHPNRMDGPDLELQHNGQHLGVRI